MWTLQSTNIAQNTERRQFLSVVFTFLNSVDKSTVVYAEPNVPDQANIPKLAADWLRQFNKIETQIANPISDAEIQAGIDALLTPPAPPTPTQSQLDQQAYQNTKRVLSQVDDLVTAGALAPDDQTVLDAKAAVVAAAQPILATVQAAVADVAASVGVKVDPIPSPVILPPVV
jgi:hypothetical protein